MHALVMSTDFFFLLQSQLRKKTGCCLSEVALRQSIYMHTKLAFSHMTPHGHLTTQNDMWSLMQTNIYMHVKTG